MQSFDQHPKEEKSINDTLFRQMCEMKQILITSKRRNSTKYNRFTIFRSHFSKIDYFAKSITVISQFFNKYPLNHFQLKNLASFY
jgi:hypothetical protein